MATLDEATCLLRLGRHHRGRLGFSSSALPFVQPVTYSLKGMVARLPLGGAALAAAQRGAVACLQVNDQADDGDAMSLLATGRLRVISEGVGELQIELVSAVPSDVV